MESWIPPNFDSLRNQAYARYVNFFQNLFSSSSREVRHLVRIISKDVRSVTSRNVELIRSVSGMSPWDYSKWRVKMNLPKAVPPENNSWREGLLSKLLESRKNSQSQVEDTKLVDAMIDSLCST